MSNKPEAQLDAVFGALAHPIRRDIVSRLGKAAACVGELAAPHGVSLAAISKHLDVLENAGIVQRRRQGRQILCELQRGPVEEAARWTEAHSSLWRERLSELEAIAQDLKAVPARSKRSRKRAKDSAS